MVTERNADSIISNGKEGWDGERVTMQMNIQCIHFNISFCAFTISRCLCSHFPYFLSLCPKISMHSIRPKFECIDRQPLVVTVIYSYQRICMVIIWHFALAQSLRPGSYRYHFSLCLLLENERINE